MTAKAIRVSILLLTLIITSCYCTQSLFKQHNNRPEENISSITFLPLPIAEIVSLEFKGLMSDFLMLDILTYMGEKLFDNQEMNEEEWRVTYLALKQIINLDPRSSDPYVIAATSLPFEAGMVKETNEILLQAAEMRPHDHRPYFFLWYNYFSFLNDPDKAGYYLKKAAKIPGAPKYYAALASRMNVYSGQLYGAIVFLKEMINETTDPSMIKYLLLREDVLKKMLLLEQSVDKFKKMFGNKPTKLEELLKAGILTKIPEDPYGGTFFINSAGRVYTTSNLVSSQPDSK